MLYFSQCIYLVCLQKETENEGNGCVDFGDCTIFAEPKAISG